MPAERLPMRRIKEIMRLKWDCRLLARHVSRSLRVARSTLGEYSRRARAAGLSWPLPEELDKETSERPLPDWAEVHQELRHKGLTLFLLWGEYKSRCPEGVHYSRFCELYRQWARGLELSMRQEHKAGEKMFVDYCGESVEVFDREPEARSQA